jgi:hypothetical protein
MIGFRGGHSYEPIVTNGLRGASEREQNALNNVLDNYIYTHFARLKPPPC